MQQTSLDFFFQDNGEIELWLRLGVLDLHSYRLLVGDYTICDELPDVERCLPKNVKSNLKSQRLLARQNFMGVVANKPVIVVGFLRNVGAVLGEINDNFEGGEEKTE